MVRFVGERKKWLLALAAMVCFASVLGSPVHAQNMMRSPNFNMGPRIPNFNPSVGVSTAIDRASSSFERSTSPCGNATRDIDDECHERLVKSGGGSAKGGGKGPQRRVQVARDLQVIPDHLLAELDAGLTDAQTDALARRHGLVRIQSQNFALIGATIGLFRITGGRPLARVSQEFAAEAGVRRIQPDFRYLLQEGKPEINEGDPAQYALQKLRLPEAHGLAHGAGIKIAVIDSGIDLQHPELAGAVTETFDALGSKEGPHPHGTAVAGVIAAHGRLMGSAPAARILAIRAFGAAANGAEGSSFAVLRGLDYAAGQRAQIVNMSFAGPKDALIGRAIAALAAKGTILVAAGGNAGPKSPPLYPAAYAPVIAVSATDAQDKLLAASNRGDYIAISAPGADIFAPAPGNKYQLSSGTSLSAAFISGIAGLMLERNAALTAEELRAILQRTARDLGAPGRDALFGAGEADAFSAVSEVTAPAGPAVAGSADRPDLAAAKAGAVATPASGMPQSETPAKASIQ